MKILIRKNAGKEYSHDDYNETLKKLRGAWVEVDTKFLFSNQYNVKGYDLRVYDSDIDAVQDDARRGLVKCGYCGAQFYSMDALQAHYAEEEQSAHNCAACRDFVKRCIDIKHDRKEETDADGNRIVTNTTKYIYGNACRWETGCNKLEHRNHKPFVFGPDNTYFLKYPNGYAAYFADLPAADKWREMGFEWNTTMRAAQIRKADTGSYIAYLAWTPNGWELLLKNSRRSIGIPADRVHYCLSNSYSIDYCMTYTGDGREKTQFADTWESLPGATKRAAGAAIKYIRGQMQAGYKREFIDKMEG